MPMVHERVMCEVMADKYTETRPPTDSEIINHKADEVRTELIFSGPVLVGATKTYITKNEPR
jgi:hypothetical protein